MTEYYLQKKTIGGWSHVTSYQDLEQARTNYQRCVGNGLSGYCWRLVEVKELEVSMLNDVVEVNSIGTQGTIEPNATGMGWSFKPKPAHDAPKSTGWGQDASTLNFKASINPGVSQPAYSDLQHGLSGSVWLVHHEKRIKTRVSADKVDAMMKEGYVKGSPRTVFE